MDVGDPTDIDAYMTGDPSDPSFNGTYFTIPDYVYLQVIQMI